MSLDLGRLFRRIQHMIRPARTTAPAVETDVVQRMQVQFNEFEIRELPAILYYGLASSPPVDSDVLVAAVAGDGSNSVVIGSNHQMSRPKNMPMGAVRLYNSAGTYIQLQGNTVTIVAAGSVTINAPKVVVNGDIEATGDIKAGTVSLKEHVHSGVQGGASNTQRPVQ